MFDSFEQALLLHADLEHYSSCKDDDHALQLKWHTVAVSFHLSKFLHFVGSVHFVSYAYFSVYKCYQSG